MAQEVVDVSSSFWHFVHAARTLDQGEIAETPGYGAIARATAAGAPLAIHARALWRDEDAEPTRHVFSDVSELFHGAEALLRARPQGLALAAQVKECIARIGRMILTCEVAEELASMQMGPK